MNNMPNMSPQYEYRLIPMSSARSRAGAPGEMIDSYKLPVEDKVHEILFLFINGIPSFVDFDNEDKNLKPDGTRGWFCELSSFRHMTRKAKLTMRQSLTDPN